MQTKRHRNMKRVLPTEICALFFFQMEFCCQLLSNLLHKEKSVSRKEIGFPKQQISVRSQAVGHSRLWIVWCKAEQNSWWCTLALCVLLCVISECRIFVFWKGNFGCRFWGYQPSLCFTGTQAAAYKHPPPAVSLYHGCCQTHLLRKLFFIISRNSRDGVIVHYSFTWKVALIKWPTCPCSRQQRWWDLAPQV